MGKTNKTTLLLTMSYDDLKDRLARLYEHWEEASELN